MKKKPPKLSLVKQSDNWKQAREEIKSMIASLSDEKLLILLEMLEQLALKEKAASPLRRKARKDKIHTERAGKIRRVK